MHIMHIMFRMSIKIQQHIIIYSDYNLLTLQYYMQIYNRHDNELMN